MATSIITGLDPGAGTININGRVYNMDGAGNFTIPLNDATALFGLGLVREVVSCATADRPTESDNPLTGTMIFDTDLGIPLWWYDDGDAPRWIKANGTDADL